MRLAVRSFTVILASALAAAAALSGCEDSPSTILLGGGDQGAGEVGGAGGAPFVDTGKQLWAGIEAELVENCAECHDAGGIGDAPFLAGPDRYQSVLSWPGIVVLDPSESSMLTYPVSGSGHNGTNLDSVPGDLLARVRAWLEAEAAAIQNPVETPLAVDPFTPIMGLNVVYLTPIDPALTGVAIIFTAEELTPNSLRLSEMTVYTTSMTGVHIVHPVFAVYPKGSPATADPVDSFAGFDTYYPENQSGAFGAGTLILTNWEPEAKLGLGFEACAPWTEAGGAGGGGGGGPGGSCTALPEFSESAAPQLQARCVSCHGGGNGQATAAVDMTDLGTDDAAACAQVKNRVNLTTPQQSQIFVVTNPNGNAAHPYKFGGDAGLHADFMTELTLWISAE